MQRNGNPMQPIVMAMIALAFAFMALIAVLLGDDFLARMFAMLAVLCFGGSGIKFIKDMYKDEDPTGVNSEKTGQ